MENDHYFTAEQSAPLRTSVIEEYLLGQPFSFTVAPGVFSNRRIDKGSRLLVETSVMMVMQERNNQQSVGEYSTTKQPATTGPAAIKPASTDATKPPHRLRVLDLGCGYGVVGVAFAKFHPETEVLLTDINPRAVMLAKENCIAAKLQNTKTKVVDGLGKTGSKSLCAFDLILHNPPQAAGLKMCYRLIEEACQHLAPGGSLLIVSRHNKGGSRLAAHMESCLGNMQSVKKAGQYRVYQGIKER